MTTEELRAAAERVLAEQRHRHEAHRIAKRAGWNLPPDEWPESVTDGEAVAAAWLAANPADDAEPVTEEWLRAIGFTGPDGLLGIIYGEVELTTTTSSRWLVGNPSEIHGESVYIPAPTTRGDVRRLCAALGVQAGEEGTA